MPWTQAEKDQLIAYHSEAKYFFSEIAKLMNKPETSVRYFVKVLGLKVHPQVHSRRGRWNNKFMAIQEPVMDYFLDHTAEETAQHFNVTMRQLKGIFTAIYMREDLQHLRKTTRRLDAWNLKEMLYLLKHAGFRSRQHIAAQLKRGTKYATAGCLFRLRIGSKMINGLPYRYARLLTDHSGIKTETGAEHSRLRLYPWCLLERELKDASPEITACIAALAVYQRWIYGVKSNEEALALMEGIAYDLAD